MTVKPNIRKDTVMRNTPIALAFTGVLRAIVFRRAASPAVFVALPSDCSAETDQGRTDTIQWSCHESGRIRRRPRRSKRSFCERAPLWAAGPNFELAITWKGLVKLGTRHRAVRRRHCCQPSQIGVRERNSVIGPEDVRHSDVAKPITIVEQRPDVRRPTAS